MPTEGCDLVRSEACKINALAPGQFPNWLVSKRESAKIGWAQSAGDITDGID